MSAGSRSILSVAQLEAEMARCEYCEAKPCRQACPADCSPADFIMAARGGEPSDFRRAAALIMAANPLGGVCGAVCPETHCMAACARAGFDRPVEIPAVQAAIIARARALGVMPRLKPTPSSGRRVAVVGSGPAGLGAAALLAQHGCAVTVFEAGRRPGGMLALIPPSRLEPGVTAADIEFVAGLGEVRLVCGNRAADPSSLLAEDFEAVVVAAGLEEPLSLGVPGEEMAIPGLSFLATPDAALVQGRRVAVVGGGAVAADCATTAVRLGAPRVEVVALETLAELPLTRRERDEVIAAGVHLTGRTRVVRLHSDEGRVTAVDTVRVTLPPGVSFHPSRTVDVPGGIQRRFDIDAVIVAIGARPSAVAEEGADVFLAGDLVHGPTTVVEAVAAGKNAALRVLASFGGSAEAECREVAATAARLGRPKVKSFAILPGRILEPVPLETDFFGTAVRSPLLLSAAPSTDGYAPMKRAYEAGWAGGVMKTAFDDVPIHVPARYMVAFARTTFGNCDNVSAHGLQRVCREIERLRREYPDRLTLASTGGPVTGDDEADRAVWQSNTAMLEGAGTCGIEYSLSCPQGGDGTKGDIVSQDPDLTAKIVGWVLATGAEDVPKLFKLTPAVTSIHPVARAVRQVFERYPRAKAGVTLANTFPTLAFRPGARHSWDEGILVGMSGSGIAPITRLTLAQVARWGLVVSANGGAMGYRTCADFLALGACTVQLCSVVMKYGVGILDELHAGLSHLLEARGLRSVDDLVACALPDAVTPFDALPATKQISQVEPDLCQRCGNCSRCPYLAITPGDDGLPRTDPSRCVGCSFCVLQCFAGALSLRDRSAEELSALAHA
jgi:NADPH-dependent glutamate synthase beta subunit-like oxidoreductase/dihydroorotate dehydrogenase/Pyruvate/2-oxoacid:ferredoxin oxidoreductase delta subunit